LNHLAPIVLFVYNRPEHTKQTLAALQKNTLAPETELFIYSDAAKNTAAQANVDEVRKMIMAITGFKKLTIVKQEKNIGLANSIISGVSEIVNKYGKVIVLEDDLLTSPHFLTFMNNALNYHKENPNVWHISGWNYPIEQEGLSDTFLWRAMNCWGWATWADRWQHFDKNTEQLIEQFSKDDISNFNLDGTEDFWGQVLANKAGEINTWAIYWYATIFKNKGLCLNPSQTYVDNIGLDGSGEHCDANDAYESQLNSNIINNFGIEIIESKIALSRIQKFYKSLKKSFITRVVNKLARVILKKNLIK